jgi:hypothetical protein
MTFDKFLLTASLDHNEALSAAKLHEEMVGHLLDATSINGLLTAFKLLGVVKAVSENPAHPAYNDCLAVWVALLGNHPFNFKLGNMTGEGQIAALDRLINTDLTEHAVALNQFKQTVLYFANTITYPFINSTLHDVLITRNVCPVVPVTQSGGWVVITTTADCPSHRPQLLALNTRTGLKQRINNFADVSGAGAYECRVHNEWLSAALFVDNAYGAL